MKLIPPVLSFILLLLLLSACATQYPMGPRVRVMPAPGKPFEVFAEEDRICRLYAAQSVGQSPGELASQSATGTAVTGLAVGTAVGALAGGREGAPTGAAVGLLAGTAAGSEQGAASARDVQMRYDISYEQCMYAKGNQVPGYPVQQIPPPPRPSK